MSRVAPLLVLLFSLFGCTSEGQATRSFYFWKAATGEASTTDDSLARALGVNHFYIHFLDIDWSEAAGEPVPRFTASFDYNTFYAEGEYTPVVFITPRTFDRMTAASDPDSLAARLARKLTRMTADLEERHRSNAAYRIQYPDYSTISDYSATSARIEARRDSLKAALIKARAAYPTEIQIDCDWTAGTRTRYFAFLTALKARLPGKELSVTVRLYPYKYCKKLGVPPVDRGMLMAYNLSPVNSATTTNSILDVTELKKYLGGKKYPLPMDIALPTFRWSAWQRDGALQGLMHNLAPENFDTAHVRRMDAPGMQYRVVRDTVVDNNYLRIGDVLRDERVSSQTLEAAASLLRSEVQDIRRTAFFHWEPSIADYATTIQTIYRGR